jgi:hypothetical protein
VSPYLIVFRVLRAILPGFSFGTPLAQGVTPETSGRGKMMKNLTKTIVVNGQELVMSSLDGQSWFLRVESMYEFEKRQHEGPKADELEIEEPVLELEPEENLVQLVR